MEKIKVYYFVNALKKRRSFNPVQNLMTATCRQQLAHDPRSNFGVDLGKIIH